jgi:adenylate cyclase
MTDVFISYARSTADLAERVGEGLRALGYGVWRDDELPAHRAYTEVIEERLRAAKAVVVIWSAEAVKSQWVRAEANVAREAGTLVQVRVDDATPPLPFNEIQCVDLAGWSGDADSAGWRKVAESIAALAGGEAVPIARPAAGHARAAPAPARGPSICVLPFVNMSGDLEQEYFSDGISEDVITDLSKVSALDVCARNTAFTFKGRSVRAPDLARELGVSHVLEGSVRRAGGRVRITAQLIDGATGNHVWADRYDRELTDIFALQDEISQAIVSALRLRLLPAEKTAIERRGTTNADAYEIYLMGRQQWLSGDGSVRAQEAILRLARRATEIDPDYAQAWALMAHAQTTLHVRHGHGDQDGAAAVERALALDPNLADAHAIKARHLAEAGRIQEAEAEMAEGLRLDAAGFEVNQAAAYMRFRQGRIEDAIRHYELAAAAPEAPIGVQAMLMTCYQAVGDKAGQTRAARATLERAQARLAKDANNTDAIAFGVSAHALLGDADSARAWVRRAMLVDPDNRVARYNLACGLGVLGDRDTMLELLAPYYATATVAELAHARVDPDLDVLRDDPRFTAMLAEAEERLGSGGKKATKNRKRP